MDSTAFSMSTLSLHRNTPLIRPFDRVEDQERIRESVKTTQKRSRPTLDLPPLPALPAVERKRKRECDPTPSTGCGSSIISGAASLSSQPNAGDAGEGDQSMEEGEGDEEELYTTLATQVVGTKYYTGMVGLGEQVNLVREPTNQYDGNAIKVTNISNIQV
jgi:SWI/SNF-related matrix-associated actin-dependent regulator of chromatin subfamily A3